MSLSRNPHFIQPYIKKCFENLNKIKFKDVDSFLLTINRFVSLDPIIMPEEIEI